LSSLPRDTHELRKSQFNDEMIRMTESLIQIGPNVNEISRHIKVFKETLRYRYKKLLLEEGFVISAITNYSKLGLQRFIMIAKIAPIFEPQSAALLSAMSELCYLHSYWQTIPDGATIMHVTVPKGLGKECISLYKRLKDIGLFTQLEIHGFEKVRNPPMKPEYYDFGRGTWAFDWPSPEVVINYHPFAGVSEDVEKYDMTDLLILKELDKDATRTMKQISEIVKVSRKTIEFHYNNHVLKRGLIRGYRLYWRRARDDSSVGKIVKMPHNYVDVGVLLTGATEAERAELASLLNRTPFLWGEASEPDYYGELFIPVHMYIEFLEYLKSFSQGVAAKMRLYVLDYNRGSRFAISYMLFDESSRKWRLDSSGIISRFQNLILNANSISR